MAWNLACQWIMTTFGATLILAAVVAKSPNYIDVSAILRRVHRQKGPNLTRGCIMITLRTDEIFMAWWFPTFLCIFDLKNEWNLGVLDILWRTHGRDGHKRKSTSIFFTLCIESCLVCHWFYGSNWGLCQHWCLGFMVIYKIFCKFISDCIMLRKMQLLPRWLRPILYRIPPRSIWEQI